MINTCTIASPLGDMTASAENNVLIGLWFVGQKYYPIKAENWIYKPDDPVFQLLREWLRMYFDGEYNLPELPLAPKGTSFQKLVWDILLKIPMGKLCTYGEIAREIAIIQGLASMSAQAVGGAVGHNPISIVIPCHRVVGSNRKLTGYAGGLDRKAALLKLEHIDLSQLKLDGLNG